MPNQSSTWSSIWRCWAVTQVTASNAGRRRSSWTSGAIFTASGRVPKTSRTRGIRGSLLVWRQAGTRSGSRREIPRPLDASGERRVAVEQEDDPALGVDLRQILVSEPGHGTGEGTRLAGRTQREGVRAALAPA